MSRARRRVQTYVEVDLSEIDEDDLVEELKERSALPKEFRPTYPDEAEVAIENLRSDVERALIEIGRGDIAEATFVLETALRPVEGTLEQVRKLAKAKRLDRR